MKTFTRNYNGEPIKANEVMVPFEYTELDAETVTNPECISTIKVGGKAFRVIYKAVDQAWEKDARAVCCTKFCIKRCYGGRVRIRNCVSPIR